MKNYLLVSLLSLLFCVVVFSEPQTCRSVTTTTCDHENSPSPSLSRPGNAVVKRGKQGAKGEKGDRGPVGPAGSDQSDAILEVSMATAKNAEEINEHSSLLSEMSGEISKVESSQQLAELLHNQTLERLVGLVGEQNEKIRRLTEHVDDLSSCEVPVISHSTTNSSSKISHGENVQYSCELYFEPEGETTRKCSRGKLIPSFHSHPLKCTKISSLTWKEAKMHCNKRNRTMAITGIETTAKRRELCRRSGMTSLSYVWLGFTKEETGEWKMSDGSQLPHDFEFQWWGGSRGLPSRNSNSGWDFMMVQCQSDHPNFGKLNNRPNSYNRDFICE